MGDDMLRVGDVSYAVVEKGTESLKAVRVAALQKYLNGSPIEKAVEYSNQGMKR
jgi:hypothetical protein